MLLDEGDPTQRFKIGTRVGRDLAVFYSTRLDGTEQRWVGQWNPRGGRFTFRAIQDSEEGQIVEATDRLTFNVFPGRARREKPQARSRSSTPCASRALCRCPRRSCAAPRSSGSGSATTPCASPRPPTACGRGWSRPGSAARRSTRSSSAAERGRGHVDARAEGGGGAEGRRLLDGRRPRRQGAPERPSRPGRPTPRRRPRRPRSPAPRASSSQAAGHYEAKVGHELRGSGAEVEIVLSVARGPRGQGVDVEFEGNERLTGEELLRTAAEAGVAGVLRRARPPGAPGGRRAGRLRGPRPPARARRAPRAPASTRRAGG